MTRRKILNYVQGLKDELSDKKHTFTNDEILKIEKEIAEWEKVIYILRVFTKPPVYP
jgi:hypothetical protein